MGIKDFEYKSHTADIEFVANGKTLKDVFCNAAKAFSNSIVPIEQVENKKEELVEIRSESLEACLYDFLSALLVIHETKHMIFCDFMIKSLRRDIDPIEDKKGWYLLCKAYGDKLDTKKHSVDAYVKAITYSQMKLEKVNGGFRIQVVLDI
jgi:SHS2 domain-containing protein